LLHRFGTVQVAAPVPIVLRLATLMTLVLVAVQSFAHGLSLRVEVQREEASGLESLLAVLGIAGSAALAGIAAVLVLRPLAVGPTAFGAEDAPFFLLAGAVVGCGALAMARAIPTLRVLFVEERSFYTGRTYLSRSKSIVMPAMVAFALLFLVVLVMLVLGVGLVGILDEVPRNTVLIAVFGLILAALVVSVAVALLLSRTEDKATLYRRHRSAESRRSLAIVGGSAALSGALLLGAAWLATGHVLAGLGPDRWLDLFAFGLMAILGPYGFYAARRYRRIRALEERFPDFLRDIAASRKAGLTLGASVAIAARGEYGALTPEIVKMADQLSWDVPFDEALDRFAERVRTPLIQRTVSLVNEASRSGGNVTDVLLAAARDARELKNLENDRRVTMSLYTAIVYITFFVFLTVAAVLYGTFIPEILKTGHGTALAGHSLAGLQLGALSLEDYRVFYFLAALVQGVGNGFVAGVMGSGKTLDGLRHSFVMVLITYVTFTAVVPMGG
jgi:flagellar protein FlaJ